MKTWRKARSQRKGKDKKDALVWYSNRSVQATRSFWRRSSSKEQCDITQTVPRPRIFETSHRYKVYTQIPFTHVTQAQPSLTYADLHWPRRRSGTFCTDFLRRISPQSKHKREEHGLKFTCALSKVTACTTSTLTKPRLLNCMMWRTLVLNFTDTVDRLGKCDFNPFTPIIDDKAISVPLLINSRWHERFL